MPGHDRDLQHAVASLRQSNTLLESIHRAQSLFVNQDDAGRVFSELLEILVEITGSEFGFLDEVVPGEGESLVRRSLAITNICWDEASRRLYEELVARNWEFPNLDNLAGAAAATSEFVIADNAAEHPRFRGLPEGHPPIRNFMGLPLCFGGQLIGTAGVANSPHGYNSETAELLEAFAATCGSLIQAERSRQNQQQALAALRESEERFRLFYEQSPLGYQSLDEEGNLIEVNTAWLAMLGYAREEVLGRWFGEFLAPQYVEKFREGFAEFKARGEARGRQFEMIRKDGTPILVEFDGRVGHDERGRFKQTHCVMRDITERKRAEEALEASEAALNEAQEIAEIGSFTWDMRNDWLVWSKNMFALAGMSPEEEAGNLKDMMARIIHPDDLANVESQIIRMVAEKQTWPMEFRVVRPDGRERIWWSRSRFICDEKGVAVKCVGVHYDITEHREAESEREITIALLGQLNAKNNAHDLMSSVTSLLQKWSGCEAVGVRLRAREDFPYFETWGFPAEFVAKESGLCARDRRGQVLRDGEGNPILECMCGNVIAGRFDPAEPFFTPGGSFWTNSTSELLAATSKEDRKGKTRNRCHRNGYESVALVPLRVSGETLGLLQFNDRRKGKFHRRRIELLERLANSLAIGLAERRAVQSLRGSEARCRAILDASLTAVALLARDGTIVEANDVHASWLGVTRQEEIGRCIWDFFPPEVAAARKVQVERVFATGQPLRAEDEREGVWYDYVIYPLCDDQGRVKQVALHVLDSTDRKRAQQRMLEAERLRAAAERLAATGRMAAHIAHEINNPLAGIKNSFRLIKDAVPADHPDRDMVAMIDREIDRIANVVRHVYRLHSDLPQPLARESLQGAIRDTLMMLESFLRIHEVEVQHEPLGRDVFVEVASGGVQQVLYNLLANAVEASPKGASVRIEVALNGKMVDVMVSDSGGGVPPRDGGSIFDPFVSTKRGRGETGSLGLGLSIVKGVVESSGGSIRFDSPPGCGTTFHVSFRLADESASQDRGAGHERLR